VGEDEASFLTPGSPITFSQTPVEIRRGVPRSGQHTAEVLGDGSPWET
jgi:crotonobetainyl-CoA:carnitine CoA-transferase CaiB-like acyl-CoA transferase